MPTPLDLRLALNTATPEEHQTQARYAAIMEVERQRQGLASTEPMGNRLMAKSALYHRLMAGQRALIVPPPLSYSYPWYSVVENAEPQEIEPPTDWNPSYLKRPADAPDQVLVNQGAWDVLERQSETDLRVSQPHWHALGFIWRIWREDLHAADCKAVIVPWHNLTITRITTEEQLQAEALHFARQWRDDLLAAQAPAEDEAPLPPLLGDTHGGPPTVDEALLQRHIRRQGRQASLQELKEREAAGLPAEPSEAEVLARAAEEFAQRLGDEWFIQQGQLYHRTWLIQRLAPAVLTEEHYLAL